MSLTNEDLLAISNLLDRRIGPLEGKVDGLSAKVDGLSAKVDGLSAEVTQIKLTQENIIIPRLNTIEACYIDTYKRYQSHADRMETAFEDIDLLKRVVEDHSEILRKRA